MREAVTSDPAAGPAAGAAPEATRAIAVGGRPRTRSGARRTDRVPAEPPRRRSERGAGRQFFVDGPFAETKEGVGGRANGEADLGVNGGADPVGRRPQVAGAHAGARKEYEDQTRPFVGDPPRGPAR